MSGIVNASVELVIEAKPRPVGNSTVMRALPVIARRAIGAFVFVDHFGPLEVPPGEGFDVGPHPHIGLSTVTSLFAGEILHRDSLGSEQLIHPGDLNWMTAGRGIVHSERSTPRRKAEGGPMHGLQIWVALPRDREEMAPEFHHVDQHDLPTIEGLGGVGSTVRLLAGSAYGARAPLETHHPLFYLDAILAAGATLRAPDEHRERGVYVVEGTIAIDGETYGAHRLLVLRPETQVTITASERCRLALFGGAPLDEPRLMDWNFVSSSRERIEAAKRDWREGRFPTVPSDDGPPIPLPERHK